jgi:hypothetical protein
MSANASRPSLIPTPSPAFRRTVSLVVARSAIHNVINRTTRDGISTTQTTLIGTTGDHRIGPCGRGRHRPSFACWKRSPAAGANCVFAGQWREDRLEALEAIGATAYPMRPVGHRCRSPNARKAACLPCARPGAAGSWMSIRPDQHDASTQFAEPYQWRVDIGTASMRACASGPTAVNEFSAWAVGRQNLSRAQIGDADAVLDLSGSCSPPCKPRRVHSRSWCSRTCAYAISSRCSPVRLERDRRLGFASGTSSCGSSLAGSASAGAGICPSSHPRR